MKLIFASSTDKATLDEVRKRLSGQARALQTQLFTTPLQDYVTVVMPKKWKGSEQGLYQPYERSITSKTPGMQLVHEYTHALHFDDMTAHKQFHQNWVIEGLATLFEHSVLEDDKLVPRQDYRLKIIKRQVDRGHEVPWKTYVKWNQKEVMKAPGNHYSQAQSMMFYLYEQGKLRQWYDAYVENFGKDSSGAAAFEEVFDKPLADIDADWVAWVRGLELPEKI